MYCSKTGSSVVFEMNEKNLQAADFYNGKNF